MVILDCQIIQSECLDRFSYDDFGFSGYSFRLLELIKMISNYSFGFLDFGFLNYSSRLFKLINL